MTRPLSNREKWLSIGVGAVVAFFAVVFLLQSFFETNARLRGEIASKQKQLRLMQMMVGQSTDSEQRDAWLQSAQPRLTNVDTAGVALLNQVKEIAQRHGMLLQNHNIRPPEARSEYTSIAIEVDSVSAWESLIDFQYDLQDPAQFIALESTNLTVDASDSTKMRGRFKIARWFAPH
jgi:ABC-type transporter Mla MlaB component